jgi:DNA-nicking Smr family endonuclease
MRKLTNEEKTLFQEAMMNVKPLKKKNFLPPKSPKLKPIPKQLYRDEAAIFQDMLSDIYDPSDFETGEELTYLKDGVQRSILRKLRRGHYSVLAELDLHGMTTHEARQAVSEFLRNSRLANLSCLRIIHGKGYNSYQKQPVLKSKLNSWLRQHEHVQAFCSARASDGGTGAVYVLIKSHHF